MERKTRSGKIVAPSPTVEPPKAPTPGKRGRKKKSEIIENAAVETKPAPSPSIPATRRSTRGRASLQSEQSLNESSNSMNEEDSNISAMSVTEEETKPEFDLKAALKAEALIKTLEIKLVDCCLQEKIQKKEIEEVKNEDSMDVEILEETEEDPLAGPVVEEPQEVIVEDETMEETSEEVKPEESVSIESQLEQLTEAVEEQIKIEKPEEPEQPCEPLQIIKEEEEAEVMTVEEVKEEETAAEEIKEEETAAEEIKEEEMIVDKVKEEEEEKIVEKVKEEEKMVEEPKEEIKEVTKVEEIQAPDLKKEDIPESVPEPKPISSPTPVPAPEPAPVPAPVPPPEEVKLLQDAFEEVSFLRRSRRLKSIYSETPPVKPEENPPANVPAAVSTEKPAAASKKQTEAENDQPQDDRKAPIAPKLEQPEQKPITAADKAEATTPMTLQEMQCDPRLSQFITIKDNIYVKSSDKVICKVNKTMKCDCTITEEDLKNGEMGCRYNCINRLLFIECSSKCRCGEFCDNQQFQRYNYAPVSVFKTEKKGFGIRADDDIPADTFVIEYVGEVLNNKQFEKRAKKYSKDKNRHYYFMALRSNAVIDATSKGNISRFINHSCDPNAMTQKWTVNGELRVGFFSIRDISRGEEITFDYQFQRYGKEAQKCFCESEKCRGWIGENPMSDEEAEVEVDEAKVKKGGRGKKAAAGAAARKTKAKADVSEEVADEDEEEEEDVKEEENEENLPPEKETEEQQQVKKEVVPEKIVRKPRKRQDIEDLEIEEEINDLIKSGLKNRAHTIRLARLVVRAKSTDTRNRILKILITGDFPCRRLFLDYNGLRLLHNWMCDISVKNSIPDLYLCMELMNALDLLPITNKTVLRESKVLERIEKWRNLDLEKKKLSKEEKKQAKAEKKKNKAAGKMQADVSFEANKSLEEYVPVVRTFDVLEELPMMKLIVKETAAELLKKWEVLKEDFKIPKKQKQEIMIEHEREAGMEEWQTAASTADSANNERYKNRFGEDSFSGSSNSRSISTSYKKTSFDPLERQKRRQMYAMKLAQEEMEKKMNALHESNCALFGLPPSLTHPLNVPFRVNRVTGEYCNILGAALPVPPNHHNFKYEPLTLSTNPDDYNLPPIDLPEHWKFAIDKYGRIYYYHEKIRQPQWEAPIKILPLNVNSDSDDLNDLDSDESETETEDSEEEELRELLEMLKKKKQLMASQAASSANPIDADEDDLEKKIMSNMLSNPPDQAIKLSQLPVKKCLKKKSRRGLSTMKFIRPRTEEDKLYGRTETKRYKELKEKLRRDKKRRMLLGESAANMSEEEEEEEEGDSSLAESSLAKMVDELDILTKSKQLDKIRKIKKDVDVEKKRDSPVIDPSKMKPKAKPVFVPPPNPADQSLIKRQFRDDIKEEIMRYLQPYRDESCVNGRITSLDDYNSLVNKLTFSVLTKESKHCAQSNSTLKATDSVKGKTKEYIKKYMSKFEGAYQRKSDEQDYANILNRI